MTLTQLMNNLNTLKVKKVKGQNVWRVIDLNCSERWAYVAEFKTKAEAENFVWNRAHR